MSAPVVLGGGFDYMAFTAKWLLPGLDMKKYDAIQSELSKVRGEEFAVVNVAGVNYKILSYRMKGYLKFASEEVLISVNPELNPTIKVTLTAYGVHKFGLDFLFKQVKDFVSSFGGAFEKEELVYRQDFHVDVQMDKLNVEPKNVLSRGKKIMVVMDDELHVETLAVGERGKENIFIRMYDKKLQIEASKDYWNWDVLNSYPLYNPALPVLRIELEIGGGWMDSNHVRALRSIENMKCMGGSLIRHLVGHYIRLVVPIPKDGNCNRWRDAIDLPVWVAVREWVETNYKGDLSAIRVRPTPLSFNRKRQNSLERVEEAYSSHVALHEANDVFFDEEEFKEAINLRISSIKGQESYRKKVRRLTPIERPLAIMDEPDEKA